jgi:uncharacterized protein YjbJ (UPF0337 family)
MSPEWGKEIVGKVTDDAKFKGEGTAEKVESSVGGAKNAPRDSLK